MANMHSAFPVKRIILYFINCLFLLEKVKGRDRWKDLGGKENDIEVFGPITVLRYEVGKRIKWPIFEILTAASVELAVFWVVLP
jgi:hypothetical protein